MALWVHGLKWITQFLILDFMFEFDLENENLNDCLTFVFHVTKNNISQ